MNLKELRLRSELTTHKVAQQLQIVESTVRNWESGRTIPRLRLDQFQHLCKIYRCEFDELCAAFQKTQAQLEEKQAQFEDTQRQIEKKQPYFEESYSSKKVRSPFPEKSQAKYSNASESVYKYLSEEEIISKYVLPKLEASGWDGRLILLHHLLIEDWFSDYPQVGRALANVDCMLRYTRDFALAIVGITFGKRSVTVGLNQAKEYAKILGLKFAYCTNGNEIIEWDEITGRTKNIDVFPTPEELWKRFSYNFEFNEKHSQNPLLLPSYIVGEDYLSYDEHLTINLGIQTILQNKNFICLCCAKGIGKARIAFQICWKLWNARWNLDNEYRRPKILYLLDEDLLISSVKDQIFSPFGQACWTIKGEVNRGRDIYLATFQSLDRKELYREFSPDFFDIIIINNAENWNQDEFSRYILSYFHQAIKFGIAYSQEENLMFPLVEYLFRH